MAQGTPPPGGQVGLVDGERDRRLAALKEALQKRAPDARDIGCFMCRLILEDLQEDGKLTGSMPDLHRQPVFPRSGQLAHLRLEGIPFNEADL